MCVCVLANVCIIASLIASFNPASGAGQGGAVCGLIVGHHGAGAGQADSSVGSFNNAEVLTGLFIRVKLK